MDGEHGYPLLRIAQARFPKETNMADFTVDTNFDDKRAAYRELQDSGYRLWQWVDGSTSVWHGPGRLRALVREDFSGKVRTTPLDPLEWGSSGGTLGTLAGDRNTLSRLK